MRLFIDCSYIDFAKQPTGIPRVVLKYVEAGYEWGEEHGIDVVPVVTTKTGLLPVRPLPGKSPPRSAKKYINPRVTDVVNGEAAASHLREAEHALRAAFVDAGFPESIAGVEEGVSLLFAQLAKGTKDALAIPVEPGDVVFYPAYWHDLDPKCMTALQEAGAKVFILVHDILPITFAKFYQSPWRYMFADNVLAAISNADGLFTVSRYTADAVLQFARDNGVQARSVRVMHNGFDPLVEDASVKEAIDKGTYKAPFGKRARHQFFRDNQPYLMVGTIEPKKGHIPVIESFERLWAEGLDRDLVLVGRTGWLEKDVVARIESSPYFNEKLFWFDDLDDADLYSAYKNSRALIFSSYAEGFGIPIIEAGMSGLPIICYRTEVAEEVAGSSGLFYSDFQGLAAHVRMMEDDAAHEREKAKLRGFTWPTWRETGYSLFDEVSGLTSGRAERVPSASRHHR